MIILEVLFNFEVLNTIHETFLDAFHFKVLYMSIKGFQFRKSVILEYSSS